MMSINEHWFDTNLPVQGGFKLQAHVVVRGVEAAPPSRVGAGEPAEMVTQPIVETPGEVLGVLAPIADEHPRHRGGPPFCLGGATISEPVLSDELNGREAYLAATSCASPD
jgi:hypothetical protein